MSKTTKNLSKKNYEDYYHEDRYDKIREKRIKNQLRSKNYFFEDDE